MEGKNVENRFGEAGYLELMQEVLYNGFDKPSRTGVGTR